MIRLPQPHPDAQNTIQTNTCMYPHTHNTTVRSINCLCESGTTAFKRTLNSEVFDNQVVYLITESTRNASTLRNMQSQAFRSWRSLVATFMRLFVMRDCMITDIVKDVSSRRKSHGLLENTFKQ